MSEGELILYTTEDGAATIGLPTFGGTVDAVMRNRPLDLNQEEFIQAEKGLVPSFSWRRKS
jgi:hypothetical protein